MLFLEILVDIFATLFFIVGLFFAVMCLSADSNDYGYIYLRAKIMFSINLILLIASLVSVFFSMWFIFAVILMSVIEFFRYSHLMNKYGD